MKRLSLFAVLSAAILLVACHEIDKTGLEAERVPVGQMADATRSVNVSQSEASGIAEMFLRTGAGSNMIQTKSSDTQSKRVSTTATVREDGQDMMYVFNYEGGGFVIVGSTRNYYPILAYSDKGSFILQDDMGPVDVWLDETKVNIKNSSSQSAETKAQMQQLWARYDGTITIPSQEELMSRRPQTRSAGEDACWHRIDSLQAEHGSDGWIFNSLSNAEYYFDEWGFGYIYDQLCSCAAQNHSEPSETVIGYRYPVRYDVGPLTGINWDQYAPYSWLCPNGLAGCTAVAAAQLMYYYKYPESMTWDGETFSWNELPQTYDYYNPTKHPQLMRMLGQKFQMVYSTTDGSIATTQNVKKGLDSLGYNTRIVYYTTNNPFTPTEAKNELINYKRPVIMGGYASSNPADSIGHTWLCEGAQEVFPNRMFFFTDNQPYGAGNFTQGMYTLSNPGDTGDVSYFINFYMNWGHGQSGPGRNGWYASNNVNPTYGNYQYDRRNIYVIKP